MTLPWASSTALAALLDGLEKDLLAAPTQEVQDAFRETGRAREGAVRELRSLLRDAQADPHESCPVATPWDVRHRVGNRLH